MRWRGGYSSIVILKTTQRFPANAVKELKCLSDRLSKISTEVESIGKAVDDLQEHSYQFNLKIVGIPELHDNESALESSKLCLNSSTTLCRRNMARY